MLPFAAAMTLPPRSECQIPPHFRTTTNQPAKNGASRYCETIMAVADGPRAIFG